MDKWNTQLRKGTFELAILLLIKRKPMYGYELTKNLQESSTFSIADGSIYPILKRMTTNGWVDSYKEEYEGRNRKYYFITELGNEVLNNRWEEFEQVFDFIRRMRNVERSN